jgi:hypothetical protein
MRICMGAAVICLAVVLTGCEPLSADELKRQAGTVDAVAAEGAILAGQVADERAQQTFTRVHSDDLAAEMEHTEDKLSETQEEGEVPDDLDDLTKQTISLAGDTADALDELHLHPGDADQAADTQRKLEELSNRAKDLVDELDRL